MPLTLILNDNLLKGRPEGAMRKILESVWCLGDFILGNCSLFYTIEMMM
jgi:hypothetical protein